MNIRAAADANFDATTTTCSRVVCRLRLNLLHAQPSMLYCLRPLSLSLSFRSVRCPKSEPTCIRNQPLQNMQHLVVGTPFLQTLPSCPAGQGINLLPPAFFVSRRTPLVRCRHQDHEDPLQCRVHFGGRVPSGRIWFHTLSGRFAQSWWRHSQRKHAHGR